MSSTEARTTIQPAPNRSAFGAELGTKAFVVVVSSEPFGRLVVIGGSSVSIGRGRLCRLRVSDPAVSAQHCRVSARAGGGYVIEDCASTNGTLVNGRRIEGAVELRYGDRIVIGSTILRFYVEELPDRA